MVWYSHQLPWKLANGRSARAHTHTHTHTHTAGMFFVVRNRKGRNRLWRITVYWGEWLILISGHSAPIHKRQYPLNRRLGGSQGRSVINTSPVLSVVMYRLRSRTPPSPRCLLWYSDARSNIFLGKSVSSYKTTCCLAPKDSSFLEGTSCLQRKFFRVFVFRVSLFQKREWWILNTYISELPIGRKFSLRNSMAA